MSSGRCLLLLAANPFAGLEAYAEHEFDAGPVKLLPSATYTLTLTEFLETFESDDPLFGSVTKGDEMPYVPRHQGRVNLALEVGPFGAYGSGSYVAKMREEAGAEPLSRALTTDAQLTVDAGVSYTFELPVRTRVYLQGRNISNEHDLVSRRPYGARPNAPRWIQVGAKAEF